MPAWRWRPNTTRVASSSACSLGSAASQSGTGYEPTVVVRMRGAELAGINVDRPLCSKSLSGAKEPNDQAQLPKHPNTQGPKESRSVILGVWVFGYFGGRVLARPCV